MAAPSTKEPFTKSDAIRERSTEIEALTPDSVSCMTGAGAGWYFDPLDRALYRYWDGQAWTDECSDLLTR